MTTVVTTIKGGDGKERCPYFLVHPLYTEYHDNEWGKALHDEHRLFEMLVLEGAQAGLNWLTILKKRNNYRQAFDNFNVKKVAAYNESKFSSLMQDEGIVRNRLKIKSAINNANAFIKVAEEFGSFDSYIWRFVDGTPIVNSVESLDNVPAITELSDKISKDLKKRGFSFVGSTIIYAYMQAIGIVDDHINSCWCKLPINTK